MFVNTVPKDLKKFFFWEKMSKTLLGYGNHFSKWGGGIMRQDVLYF